MYFVCTPYYGKEDIELSKYKGLDWWQNIERAHRNVQLEMNFVCTSYYGKEDKELSKYKCLDWLIERAHRNVQLKTAKFCGAPCT